MKVIDRFEKRKRLTEFGFGTDVMRAVTVCTNCNSLESSRNVFCSKCNTLLPGVNLYDFYRAQHMICSECGTVLSKNMHYCPHCGVRVKEDVALCAL